MRVVGPDARDGRGTDQPRLHVLFAPTGLAEALAQATVYVGAAGTTAVQAACVGIPAVINDAVVNQSAQAAALAEAGCAVVVDSDDLARTCVRLLDDPARCDAMADRGRDLVDGRGAWRVADAVPPGSCRRSVMAAARCVAVIQARVGSTRFPGKVLADLCGKPMLAHVIERASLAETLDDVVVATTVEPGDDIVANLAGEYGALVTRGPAADVLSRYVLAAREHHAAVVVRITSDCPLVDPNLIDRLVRLRASAGADYASNELPPTYPQGYDLEVLSTQCLMRLDAESVLDYHREHVTARIRGMPMSTAPPIWFTTATCRPYA